MNFLLGTSTVPEFTPSPPALGRPPTKAARALASYMAMAGRWLDPRTEPIGPQKPHHRGQL